MGVHWNKGGFQRFFIVGCCVMRVLLALGGDELGYYVYRSCDKGLWVWVVTVGVVWRGDGCLWWIKKGLLVYLEFQAW